jgi:hypothetical protein
MSDMPEKFPDRIYLTENPKRERTWFYGRGDTTFTEVEYTRSDLCAPLSSKVDNADLLRECKTVLEEMMRHRGGHIDQLLSRITEALGE